MSNKIKNIALVTNNQTVKGLESMCKIEENKETMEVTVLNALENAILDYGRRNRKFVSNPYQFFSKYLGYKAPNYIYDWFKMRNGCAVKYDDLLKILNETKSKELAEIMQKDIERNLE